MRITDSYKFTDIAFTIQRNAGRLGTAGERVMTGKRINRPSDDPAGTQEVLRLRSLEASVSQFDRNMSRASSTIKVTEVALDRVHDLITQGWQYAVSDDPGTRQSSIDGVNSVLSEMFSVANEKFGGKYLFSGFRTSTQPFDPAEGGAPPYTYNGDTGAIEVAISENRNVRINVTGDEIFNGAGGGIDIFTNLENLRTGFLTDNQAMIDTAMANLFNAKQQVEDAMAGLATTHKEIEIKMESTRNFKVNVLNRITGIEDVDLASAIIEMTQTQTVYEASLSASARLMRSTLLDFL